MFKKLGFLVVGFCGVFKILFSIALRECWQYWASWGGFAVFVVYIRFGKEICVEILENHGKWVSNYCFLENQPHWVGTKLANRPNNITNCETTPLYTQSKDFVKDKLKQVPLTTLGWFASWL